MPMDENKAKSSESRASGRRADRDVAPEIPEAHNLPRAERLPARGVRSWLRGLPFLALAAYYVLLVAGFIGLSSISPLVRGAFFAPTEVQGFMSQNNAQAILEGETAPAVPPQAPTTERRALEIATNRSVQTFLVIVGSLLLVVPVAWVYMKTKRLQYDPALVRSVVILPIVVAGITMVVKYSVALAFALAGIVAAVRFRNTLKDPRDAVYIFLVIGIGLASGVQAIDVALVMSLIFNFVMLTLWRYNIGSIYGGGYGRTGVLAAGESALWVAHIPKVRNRIREALLPEVEEMETDGVLLVHAEEPELARYTVQEALSEMAKEWRLAGIAERGGGMSTLEYIIRLKKKASPADLVGALAERWSAQVLSAEYFPFLQRERDNDDEEDEKE